MAALRDEAPFRCGSVNGRYTLRLPAMRRVSRHD